MTNRVYPIGTDSYKAVERVDELMKQPTTLLIDVRLNAWSWRCDFRHTELSTMYRARYKRAGKYLGNIATAGTWRVRIASPIAGIHGLAKYLNEGYDLVLLYHDEQHIKEICKLLVGLSPEVEVIRFKQPVVTNGPD